MKPFREFYEERHHTDGWAAYGMEPQNSVLQRLCDTVADYVDQAVREALFGAADAPLQAPSFRELVMMVLRAEREKQSAATEAEQAYVAWRNSVAATHLTHHTSESAFKAGWSAAQKAGGGT